jgi:hypothetical protein
MQIKNTDNDNNLKYKDIRKATKNKNNKFKIKWISAKI